MRVKAGEQGSALVAGLLVVLVLAAISGVIASVVLESTNGSAKRSRKSLALPPADSGAAHYNLALDREFLSVTNGYQLTGPIVDMLPPRAGGGRQLYWYPNSSTDIGLSPILQKFPSDVRSAASMITLREPDPSVGKDGTNSYSFWQVYRVDVPNGGNIRVTFRTWTGTLRSDGGRTIQSEPRYIRVNFHQATFRDDALLVNGPIALEDDAELSGSVRSNGYSRQTPWAIYWGDPESGDPPDCMPGAVLSAPLTRIDPAISALCAREAAPETMEFGRIQKVYAAIAQLCTSSQPWTPAAVCYTNPNVNYDVRLGGSSVTINGSTLPVTPRGLAILLPNTATVSGTLSGPAAQRMMVTIAARNSTGGGGAADLILSSSHVGLAASNPNHAVALIAQGDIVVAQPRPSVDDPGVPNNPCLVRSVHASLVAETGGLTIPRNWTTRVLQRSAPRCKDEITFNGSIAANRAPTLFWTWGVDIKNNSVVDKPAATASCLERGNLGPWDGDGDGRVSNRDMGYGWSPIDANHDRIVGDVFDFYTEFLVWYESTDWCDDHGKVNVVPASERWSGFEDRKISWDRQMAAPFLFPGAGNWSIAGWTDVNSDCIVLRPNDLECA